MVLEGRWKGAAIMAVLWAVAAAAAFYLLPFDTGDWFSRVYLVLSFSLFLFGLFTFLGPDRLVNSWEKNQARLNKPMFDTVNVSFVAGIMLVTISYAALLFSILQNGWRTAAFFAFFILFYYYLYYMSRQTGQRLFRRKAFRKSS
ncbi:hypothetical protein [Candidatus Methanoplasma termitum]|uniref:hypothetical protein n=1 Tax=Candidatus Methanoplasma termitum TaxID=1577791 RepID=UPI00064FC2CF|nr:hypothetical protein [Candidatus Methanoplasma termitum]MCL2334358.1 hypothetical protein [Candidatus Methanoplasma sp.]